MLNKEEIKILSQYISSIEEAFIKLESAYFSKNTSDFLKIKKFILEIQAKIDAMLK
ncbi:MAG: hypothetical protein QXI33_02325 [Candidatus Pacearchaeota archaeon]